METVFHCSRRVKRSARKSRHGVLDTCEDVRDVLKLNPTYGVSIPKFSNLRKMRLNVPGLTVGKSGGYRLIYRAEQIDDVMHIIFLETYFKGDAEDLTNAEYKALNSLANEIVADPDEFDWTEPEEEEVKE